MCSNKEFTGSVKIAWNQSRSLTFLLWLNEAVSILFLIYRRITGLNGEKTTQNIQITRSFWNG